MNKKTVGLAVGGTVLAALALSGALLFSPYAEKRPSPLMGTAIAEAGQIPVSSETPLMKSFLSPVPDERSVMIQVQRGDNLSRISKKYNVTVDLIKKINGLRGDSLRSGMKLKMPSCRLNIVVDKSLNTLLLKADEEALKTYVVSTGQNNSTPVGTFKITDKLANPTWYTAGAAIPPGSPKNGLGTRWMGLSKKGYGIHGTVEPERLGQQVTAGCVRMKNEEAEELFSFLPAGAEVTIVD